jgi:CubicO group peptidase (beta-lactamase class C family)
MKFIPPESAGFSSQRLDRISTVFQRYIDEKSLAGAVTLIARNGAVVHFNRLGAADIATGKPMQLDTIFRIYSMTKPITSVAVLCLMEEGRLRLADPVSRFLPAFKQMKVLVKPHGPATELVDAEREITIRDLLTHTAGLSYGFEPDPIDELYRRSIRDVEKALPGISLEEMTGAIARLPLAFQPGTDFRYSMATDVLGYMVQVVFGMPFDVFLKQRIFDPLSMNDTAFYVPEEKRERFSVMYTLDEQGQLQEADAVDSLRYASAPSNPSGGGGLVSTVSDYWRFAQMLLNGGALDGARILSRKTIELMTANHLPEGAHPNNDFSAGFGLGVSVLTDLGKSPVLGSPGNYGWSGISGVNFWVDPREDLIGVMCTQLLHENRRLLRADFRNLTYQAMVA